MGIVEFFVLWFIPLCFAAEKAEFSNSWAVEVDGGRMVADEIANKHGFINRGQVGNLPNVYHFVHIFSPSRSIRSVTEIHPKHYHLKAEVQVGYVEQQVVKKRYKRYRSRTYSANWNKQWYLHRTNGHDMNVVNVWKQNITGRGAVVSILDDGIEYTHPDLQANYDPLASYDFNDHDEDPMPRYEPTNENKHGTRCAGEIASNKEGNCGVGVAFGAKVGGVRMLDGDVTDIVEASSLSLKPQHIHIYSSSWGPNDDGSTVDGPGILAARAFSNGVTHGRSGLGSIYVWAAGNGGRYGDSCNCDGYAVSPLTISVGSASEHDDKPWYLEQCSSTLTSTYSSGDNNEKQIVTTDLHGSCTERHTGTSASAPLAAGVMALALEANPALTWRDMQYLMVYSSNPQFPHDKHWQRNGAGLKVSHWYGFGIIDGAALINRARNWITVPQRSSCTFNVTSKLKVDIATGSHPLVVTINVESCNLKYLEHVQAITNLHVRDGMRKDVSLFLTSPSGTKSVLLPFRPRDQHKDGFHLWPFMTVHMWGENPKGDWIFSINLKHGATVKLDALNLVLYGTQSVPSSVQAIPFHCHPQCLRGCAREGAQFCDTCKKYRVALTLECVKNCPLGTYADGGMCRNCLSLCVNCSDGFSCNRCQSGVLQLPNGTCSISCPRGTFANYSSCVACHQSCLSCNGPLDTNCTDCHPQFIQQNHRCLIRGPTSCLNGEYFDHRAHECRLCHKTCASCIGKESTQCTTCHKGTQISLNHKCVDMRQLRSCYPGQYLDGSECASCPSSCSNCSDNLTCTSCHKGHYLTKDGFCVESCPQNTTSDHESYLCLDTGCHNSCLTCFGPKSTHCSSCPIGLSLLHHSCILHCPSHFYNKGDNSCHPCHNDCDSCWGPLKVNCISCSPEKFLDDQQCVLVCPDGKYGLGGLCLPCLDNCSTCSSPDSCKVCKKGFYLMDSPPKCVPHCPPTYVAHSISHSCRPCPSHCATCYNPSSCLSCQEDYVYYRPGRSCLHHCPGGYYSSATRVCNHCQSPCNTCSGSSLNCSTCLHGMALDLASQSCKECCNPDRSAVDCCDCDLDDKTCRWTNYSTTKSEVPPYFVSSSNLSTLVFAVIVIAGTVTLIVLVVPLGILFFIRHRFYFRLSKRYQKVPNKDRLDIANDSGSDTDVYDGEAVTI